MEDYLYSKLEINKKRRRKQTVKKSLIVFVILVMGGTFSLFFFKTSFTISQVTDNEKSQKENESLGGLPKENSNRINVLLLGMRGLHESGDGKLLTDAIMVASFNKKTGEAAIISFPRDLYTELWCFAEKKKINFAYFEGGLDCAKKTISYISGLHIKHALAINFEGLESLIDALGGVTVYRDDYFIENFQWAKEGSPGSKHWFIKEFPKQTSSSSIRVSTTTSTSTAKKSKTATGTPKMEERWVFYVPKGKTHLDGKTALYYVRSRYTTNDFDRMERQHQVLMAIKEKALSLGVLSNPIKVFNLLDVIGKNLKTDIGLRETKDLINLASAIKEGNIKTRVFDTTENGLLYDTFINKEYVLLPENENWKEIQSACQNIFDK